MTLEEVQMATTRTPGKVNAQQFGKIFTLKADGDNWDSILIAI